MQPVKSNMQSAQTHRSLPMLMLLGALALSACAGRTPTVTPAFADIPAEIDQKCASPEMPAVGTAGSATVHSVKQEGVIVKCDERRAAAVQIIRKTNAANRAILENQTRPWWNFWSK